MYAFLTILGIICAMAAVTAVLVILIRLLVKRGLQKRRPQILIYRRKNNADE